MDAIAKAHGVERRSGGRLAWVLKRSPVMLPIPGTSQRQLTSTRMSPAAALTLSDAEFATPERRDCDPDGYD